MTICSACGEECKEVYRMLDSVSYNHRDRNVTDRIYGFGSDCCGANVEPMDIWHDDERRREFKNYIYDQIFEAEKLVCDAMKPDGLKAGLKEIFDEILSTFEGE
jgi:hypothetical protein